MIALCFVIILQFVLSWAACIVLGVWGGCIGCDVCMSLVMVVGGCIHSSSYNELEATE